MQNSRKSCCQSFLYCVLVGSLVLHTPQAIALSSPPTNEQETNWKNDVPYNPLGEYEEIFREFQADLEAECICPKTFFLFKWWESTKRWLLRKVFKILKSVVDVEKMQDPEHCAYEIARLKRSCDKYFDMPTMARIMHDFTRHIKGSPAEHDLKILKKRVMYYHHNPKAKPYRFLKKKGVVEDTRPEHQKQPVKEELKNIPLRAVVGGLAVLCGCLIFVIPLLPCKKAGASLVTYGLGQIAEAYILSSEKPDQKSILWDPC